MTPGGRPTAGVGLFPTMPAPRFVALARQAEEAGVHTIWVGDSQNIWREALTVLGAVAAATEKVRLGTGVTNVATRHPAVLASAFATLHELSGGRMVLGVGAGDSSLATMGLRPSRLDELEASMGGIRRLLRGEEVVEAHSGSGYRLSYLGEPLDIPVLVAASRPRITELAGRVADGVILAVGRDPGLVETALGWLARGLSAAGRDRGEVEVVLWVPACIADDGEWARDQVRAHVARTVKREPAIELTGEEAAAVERIVREYDYSAHLDPAAPHSRLVTDGLVDRFALAGTPDEVAEQVRRLPGAVDQVAIIPTPRDPEDRLFTIRRFGELMSEIGAMR